MAIDYSTFKAHPTRYKGVVFRSRLEARWAAMFDGLGWRWRYEPFDLNGWVPDFMIEGATVGLVEVKPIPALDGDVVNKMMRATDGKAVRLIVCGPWPLVDSDGYTVGLHSFCGCHTAACTWRKRAILKIDGKFDIAFGHHPYPCFVTGLDAWEHPTNEYQVEEVEQLWNEAGNQVQWRKPRMPRV